MLKTTQSRLRITSEIRVALVSHTASPWRHVASSLSNWNQRFENTAYSSPSGVKWKSWGSDPVFKIHILWGHTSVHSTAWKKSSQTKPASTSALSGALLVNYRQEGVEKSGILQVPYLNLTAASPTEEEELTARPRHGILVCLCYYRQFFLSVSASNYLWVSWNSTLPCLTISSLAHTPDVDGSQRGTVRPPPLLACLVWHPFLG